jgi:hypothetical protein
VPRFPPYYFPWVADSIWVRGSGAKTCSRAFLLLSCRAFCIGSRDIFKLIKYLYYWPSLYVMIISCHFAFDHH